MAQNIQIAEALALLAPIQGEYAWAVRAGTDGVLRMDFGAPHLRVREPSPNAPDLQGPARSALQRRLVRPVGRWHLFVWTGLWEVRAGGLGATRAELEAADPPGAARIERALAQLDGQRLTGMACVPPAGTWRFEFDLGGTLSIGADPAEAADPSGGAWSIFFEVGDDVTWVGGETLVVTQPRDQASGSETVGR